jgi:hypothetical protein
MKPSLSTEQRQRYGCSPAVGIGGATSSAQKQAGIERPAKPQNHGGIRLAVT